MKFEKYSLAEEIKRNLNEIGFHKTTDIQFKCLPAVLNGEDVLAIAQTGTGKTAAFAIPIVDNIHKLKVAKKTRKPKGVHTLVLVPTRELAQQIGKVFSQIARNTGVKCFALYGGIDQDPQIQQLNAGMDIVITTPGRMFDLISQEVLKVEDVKCLVLDEADHMLDLGFIKDIQDIKKKLTQRHQTLFFSATINDKIKKLAYSQIRSSALRIQVSPEKMISKNISHHLCRVEMDQKRHLLYNFRGEHPEAKILVFVRTKVRAERVHKHLSKREIKTQVLHSDIDQDLREQNLEDFRSSKSAMMITTDISARGIDLEGITHVINYDLPDSVEKYVHRIGRTGRGFATGEAISFVSSEENENLRIIEEGLTKPINELSVEDIHLEDLSNLAVDDLGINDMLAHEEALFNKPPKKKKKKK